MTPTDLYRMERAKPRASVAALAQIIDEARAELEVKLGAATRRRPARTRPARPKAANGMRQADIAERNRRICKLWLDGVHWDDIRAIEKVAHKTIQRAVAHLRVGRYRTNVRPRRETLLARLNIPPEPMP